MILEVKNLVKKYNSPPASRLGGRGEAGGFAAIDGISFEIKEGEIVGFLGPNGAGKSTTIYCILGLIIPDSGYVRIFGEDISKNRSAIFKKVNYASADFNLPWNLTVWENLLVYAKLYEVPNPGKRIDEILEIFEMDQFRNTAIRDLSTGLRARSNLCKALLNKPKLLLLDEPMASMDPDVVDKGIRLLKQIQKEEKITILYTSHNMWEIEEVANNVIFINNGKIVAQGSPLELTQKVLKLEGKEPNLQDVFIHLSRIKDEP